MQPTSALTLPFKDIRSRRDGQTPPQRHTNTKQTGDQLQGCVRYVTNKAANLAGAYATPSRKEIGEPVCTHT